MNDHLRSLTARRQSWFGLKLPVKTALAQPFLHPVLRTIAPRMKNLKIGRLPAPIGLTEVRGRVRGAEFVLVDPFRCEIAKEFYWGKGRRTEAADAFALDLMVDLSRDAEVFLDVGAYTGVFTLAVTAAVPDIRAHAFEIVPAVVAGLRKNVERNDVSDRVTVHPTGIGRAGEWMTVPVGDGGSALPSFYGWSMDFSSGAEVRFTSLDEILPEVVGEAGTEHRSPKRSNGDDAAPNRKNGDDVAPKQEEDSGPGSPPRVTMKIDVEGAENDVLGNGGEFLDRLRPDILCEVLVDRAEPTALMTILEPFGYRYYLVGDDRLIAREQIIPDSTHRDWLFTTRSPEDMGAAGYPVAHSRWQQ